ncbi:tRNA U34 5-methylaminomethyl-2-thiouridine-forming methyltransferase MnmC [Maribacter sedimenticola]|uniref:tRNA U34 5-methylaminomethyl-2-thiouridine-forming methyltransferase MnmC n=1 Tax=Maribacter sedimenticola TaxID=228956 RepID=A0ABY1SFE1_9FLAO|nr:tRNA (5-methylaminomethyl-2-thiouridine)(34)-methyltransferase MnmD [Maribacter sedimenticola]SNR31790.1 tRNA U34 5-methylaminomethyl-2-thiouridine-forming methyltransferase MnmC [Maribacter sedimenticola]
MKREIITTADGSKTIQIKEWNEQYHSKHGAIQEAYHVFIHSGLHLFKNCNLNILEIGFGTGLNALITLIEAEHQNLSIDYTGVEAYPVSKEEIGQLNYLKELNAMSFTKMFNEMHASPWEELIPISPKFNLKKQQKDFKDIKDIAQYDLVYFDAFGARVQPELWTVDIFEIMFKAIKQGGYLVTYAAKGSVRRAMLEVGFLVERLPGPPGKREMLRAKKP